ncbi:hypothetical protein IGI04_008731 [Brassica rapa subsp. trilocularis]|uniref:Uncharacterized protein n=1 Tax=Brassica rapa subsp. trilocularis TaxID=1813537 RepID=A0ABQ7NNI0_BRACM|nr:hypothetical protein IGI04_008731 [Brassica rapa subsp. trilocularis]
MSTPRNGFSKHQRAEKVCGQGGPNWILIAGGALLSTLSIRFGYKLKQSPLFKPPHHSNASPGFKANGTSERQRCCCLHSSTTSSCAKNNGYSCFRSVPGTLFFPYVSDTELQSSSLVHLIEVSRRALTVGRDRIMQLHKVICCFFCLPLLEMMKVDKAEKLDGGEGGKRGESLVARTLGV